MDLITPGLGLIFWTAVTFLCLLLILRKAAWKPILNSVSNREKGIREALASAEEAKKEMQNLTADNTKLLKQARAERDEIMKDARHVRENIISEAKEDAKEITKKLIENAQTSIEQEKQAALAEIKKQVADLSIGIAESVIKKELSYRDNQFELVESMLKDVTLN